MSNPNRYGRKAASPFKSVRIYKQDEAKEIIKLGLEKKGELEEGEYRVELDIDPEDGLTILVYEKRRDNVGQGEDYCHGGSQG